MGPTGDWRIVRGSINSRILKSALQSLVSTRKQKKRKGKTEYQSDDSYLVSYKHKTSKMDDLNGSDTNMNSFCRFQQEIETFKEFFNGFLQEL